MGPHILAQNHLTKLYLRHQNVCSVKCNSSINVLLLEFRWVTNSTFMSGRTLISEFKLKMSKEQFDYNFEIEYCVGGHVEGGF